MNQVETVSAENTQEERNLREQVETSESVLANLDVERREIEARLKALAEKNLQYHALKQVCHSLEELEKIDGAALFWDEYEGGEAAEERLSRAYRRIDEFNAEVTIVEDQRQSILDKMDDQNVVLDYLHYDLLEALEREEQRKNQWLVERDEVKIPVRAQVMPWVRGGEEDQRFRKSLGISLAASLALAFLFSTIALPIIKQTTVDELPERIAKLVARERTPPPPAPVEPEIPEEQEPEPEPVEELPDETLPEATEQPVLAEEAQPDPKEQLRSKGILAFRDSFANRANLKPAARLGSQARFTNAGADDLGRPERMMVATSAPGSSGGINLSDISRDVGGGGDGMEGVQLSRVASSIGGGDGPNRPLSGGVSAGRTDEEIQIVFDRYKAALYRLYNRELRKNPTLRGQLVIKLTIEPDGSVSLCELHSTDMASALLAEQVVGRVQTFDFGAKEDIVAVTIIYPIDFLPSA